MICQSKDGGHYAITKNMNICGKFSCILDNLIIMVTVKQIDWDVGLIKSFTLFDKKISSGNALLITVINIPAN